MKMVSKVSFCTENSRQRAWVLRRGFCGVYLGCGCVEACMGKGVEKGVGAWR